MISSISSFITSNCDADYSLRFTSHPECSGFMRMSMQFDEERQSENDCLSVASLIFTSVRIVNGMHPNDRSITMDCEEKPDL